MTDHGSALPEPVSPDDETPIRHEIGPEPAPPVRIPQQEYWDEKICLDVEYYADTNHTTPNEKSAAVGGYPAPSPGLRRSATGSDSITSEPAPAYIRETAFRGESKLAKEDIPVPVELCNLIAGDMLTGQTHVLRNEWGKAVSPWVIQRKFRLAVDAVAEDESVATLPDGFRYHDLRHHFASLLIHAGLSVKEVQARLRHGSAKTTLDTYAHLWPDTEEAARSAVREAIGNRAAILCPLGEQTTA